MITLQRGYDITKNEQALGGSVPVVSSGGISSYHDVAMDRGPGVIIGRKGTLGRVHYVEGPFWPHDTTLWVKDFKGNDPRFVSYALKSIDPVFLNVGSASPTLNRNHVHPLPVRWPAKRQEQVAIAAVLGSLDDKIAVNDTLISLFDEHCAAVVAHSCRQAIEVRLSDVLTLHYGKALPASTRKIGQVDVYGSGGLVGHHDTALVDHSGVVIGRKGSVGTVYWADGPHYPIDTTYYVQPGSGIAAATLYYVLRTLRLSELNADSAVPGLNRDEAYSQTVRIPTGELGDQVTSAIEGAFEYMRVARMATLTLTRARDELLPLLMSGKIRVEDAEAVVAEVV